MVFITEGMSLRIPAGGLVIPVDGSSAPSVKFEVVLDTWRYWLKIATGHVDNAVKAHEELLAAHAESDDPAKGRALEAELFTQCKEYRHPRSRLKHFMRQ